ncbi:MAG: FecR family protein [Chitinophagaceae bacterium]
MGTTIVYCLETPDHIWYLIARSLSGEASPEEQEELAELLRHDALLQQQYDLLVRIWKEKQNNNTVEDNFDANKSVSRIISRAASEEIEEDNIFRKKRNRKSRRIYFATGILATLVLVGWLWKGIGISGPVSQKPGSEKIITQNGTRTRSLLHDGTTVWLNAGSKLSYDNDFSGSTREVSLEGEAFFDVVKQPNRPFIVHTSGIDIRVLGTEFNVKSYPDDKNVETTLYKGAVQVFRHEDSLSKAIHMAPNQKLIVSKQAANPSLKLSEERKSFAGEVNTSLFTITHIDSTKTDSARFETAWLYSRLEFRRDNFEELAKKLERWYNVNIIFKDDKVKKLNFNGSFEKETVDQAFNYLKQTILFNYKIEGHEIYVASSE